MMLWLCITGSPKVIGHIDNSVNDSLRIHSQGIFLSAILKKASREALGAWLMVWWLRTPPSWSQLLGFSVMLNIFLSQTNLKIHHIFMPSMELNLIICWFASLNNPFIQPTEHSVSSYNSCSWWCYVCSCERSPKHSIHKHNIQNYNIPFILWKTMVKQMTQSDLGYLWTTGKNQ